MNPSDEEWRVVAEAPDYAVSQFGRVKRIRADSQGRYNGRILKQALNTAGRPSLTLCCNGVHRSRNVATIVAIAFHGPKPSEQHQVAHWDGDKLNSFASNLRWATAKENMADKRRHGTVPMGDNHPSRRMPERLKRGEEHASAKLTWDKVRTIRTAPITQVQAARLFGISQSNVSDIRRGNIWKEAA
jgi:hypothetical protein